jgi:hypothetical protein
VVALAPTSGPSGYEFDITGPPCVPEPDERATVKSSYARSWSSGANSLGPSSAGQPLNSWELYVKLEGDSPGSSSATVSCSATGPNGERTIWIEPVGYTVTGPPSQVQLAATPSRSAGELTVVSGASLGADPCPTISGLTPQTVALGTGLGDTGPSTSEYGYTVSLPTATATISKPLPAWATAGTTGFAWVDCSYPHASFSYVSKSYVLDP